MTLETTNRANSHLTDTRDINNHGDDDKCNSFCLHMENSLWAKRNSFEVKHVPMPLKWMLARKGSSLEMKEKSRHFFAASSVWARVLKAHETYRHLHWSRRRSEGRMMWRLDAKSCRHFFTSHAETAASAAARKKKLQKSETKANRLMN